MQRFRLTDPPFAGRTGKGIRVAVIDSGIAPNHPHVGAVAEGISFIEDGAGTGDRIGHGTAIAAVIREKAPDAELVPVRIFDRELKTDAAMLARAIVWALEHDCRIANLSLGTANEAHRNLLDDALQSSVARDVMVISAFESAGTRWLPGSLRLALGVMGDAEIDRDEIQPEQSGVETWIRASIYPRPIPGVPKERNFHGVSFAVANVTGFMARRLEGASVGESPAVLRKP